MIQANRRPIRPHPHFSGWTMVGVAGLALFLSQAAQTPSVAVFIDPMLADFGWSRSLISSAFTIATLVSAAVVVVAGRLIDRRGHRGVMSVTTLAYAAALLAMGAVAGPWSLLVGFTLLRVSGGSVLSLSARTLVAQWFLRRRGQAISYVNLGKMFGIALMPPLNALLIGWVGWRDAWRLNALLVALILIPAALFVRGRPEHVGQYPDGLRPEPADSATGPDHRQERASWTLNQAMRTRAFWLLISTTAIPALVTNGLSFNQISILTSRGLSATVAAATFTVESVIAFPVTLAAGWLIDRFGPRLVLAIGNAAVVVAMVSLIFTDSVATAFVFAGLRAVNAGTWVLASEVAWPAFFGSRHLGSIQGVNFAIAFVGAAVGPLPFGLVYDAFGSYDYAIWGMALLPVATTWAALVATPPPLGEDPRPN